MCSAITRRTPRSGSRRPSPAATAALRTSSSVIRPPGPLPGTRRQIDAELLRDAADDRGRLHAARLGGRCRRRSTGCGRLTRSADDDELGADRYHVALGDEDLQHGAGIRRRDLDGRLVGLDLHERVVLGDLLPLRYEPASDLALGEALTEIRELERARHYP